MCPLIESFLATESTERIAAHLLDIVETEAEGVLAMEHLQRTRPAVANAVLCQLYDIACYRVGDTVFADSAPASEHDLYFVSVDAASELVDMAVQEMKLLYATLEAAQAAAVQGFKLYSKFSSGLQARTLS